MCYSSTESKTLVKQQPVKLLIEIKKNLINKTERETNRNAIGKVVLVQRKPKPS